MKNIKTISLIIGFIVSMMATTIILTMNNKDKEPEENRYSLLDMQLELKYWAVKSELIDSVQSYINKVAPSSNLSAIILVNECSEENVSVSFALAQGQKESHFGTRGLGAKTNSVFNVGAYDNHTIDQISNRHKYRHPNLSIKPYLKLLNDRYLVNKSEEDLLKSFVDVNKKRYASYDKYEPELKMIYERICKLTSIRSLEDEFTRLKTQREY